MTEETLQKGNDLRVQIGNYQGIAETLESPNIIIQIDRKTTKRYYQQPEDDIELTDQEKEALESLRHAYLEILRSACQRRIQNLTTEFEKL